MEPALKTRPRWPPKRRPRAAQAADCPRRARAWGSPRRTLALNEASRASADRPPCFRPPCFRPRPNLLRFLSPTGARPTLYLLELQLIPQTRSRGLGAFLMHALEELARAQPHPRRPAVEAVVDASQHRNLVDRATPGHALERPARSAASATHRAAAVGSQNPGRAGEKPKEGFDFFFGRQRSVTKFPLDCMPVL